MWEICEVGTAAIWTFYVHLTDTSVRNNYCYYDRRNAYDPPFGGKISNSEWEPGTLTANFSWSGYWDGDVPSLSTTSFESAFITIVLTHSSEIIPTFNIYNTSPQKFSRNLDYPRFTYSPQCVFVTGSVYRLENTIHRSLGCIGGYCHLISFYGP